MANTQLTPQAFLPSPPWPGMQELILATATTLFPDNTMQKFSPPALKADILN